MKKIYLFSSLLCVTMALSAQEISKLPDNVLEKKVPAKATKAYFPFKQVSQYGNEMVRVKDMEGAPAAMDQFIRPYLAYGAYYMGSRYDEEYGMVVGAQADIIYGPAFEYWHWTGAGFGFDEETWANMDNFTYTLVDLTQENDDEPLERLEDGTYGTSFFGSWPYIVQMDAENTVTGQKYTGSRLDFIQSTADSNSYFYTPVNNERNIFGAYAYFASGSFYSSWYSADGAVPDLAGFAQIFPTPVTSLYLFGGNFLFCQGNKDYAVKDLDKITFEIWLIDENATLVEKIAEAGNPTLNGDYVNGIGELTFNFMNSTGLVVSPVTIPAGQPFAIIINNVADTGVWPMFAFSARFGAIMDGTSVNTLGGGGAYEYLTDGTLKEHFGWTEPGFDFAIGLDGYVPGMIMNADYADIPEEGGVASSYMGGQMVVENAVQFASSYGIWNGDVEQITFSYPDWITMNVDTTNFSTTGNAYLQFSADKLPDGMKNRHGYVSATCFGYTISMPIGQGPDWIGVETTVAEAEVSANVVAGDFVLTYGEGVDKVDVYNVAGSLVASYALPANGSFTVPASDLAKGLYVLNFTGEKKATVKVVK